MDSGSVLIVSSYFEYFALLCKRFSNSYETKETPIFYKRLVLCKALLILREYEGRMTLPCVPMFLSEIIVVEFI